MVPDFDNAALLVIDAQDRLLGAMKPKVARRTLENIDILTDLVDQFGGRVFYTEQYPRGLGNTAEPLKARLEALEDAIRVEKVAFSVMGEPNFVDQVVPNLPETLIVTGMETHVCVLQSVFDLVDQAIEADRDLTVYIPIDAVCSRTKTNWGNGLDQLAEGPVVITNTETLVFQALKEAGTPKFKHFSRRIRDVGKTT